VSDSDIIPFGKYRDQPIEVLLADSQYLAWILAQPGLVAMMQQRYPAIYNIIVTGVPTTEDTPEHNALQARFLDRDFQQAKRPRTGSADVHRSSSRARRRPPGGKQGLLSPAKTY
jgi:hypothetical protein